MPFVFQPPAAVSLPILGSDDLFPVHRIYCVGQNYAAHAREMGATGREAPFFFMKPADALAPVMPGATGEMPYPPMTSNLHHEIELVVAIGKAGADIAPEQAAQHIWGYACGLDMTRRDLQAEAKKAGRPWDTSKGFDHSAPISPLRPAGAAGLPAGAGIRLRVNGVQKQGSTLDQLIWNVPETIAYLSKYYVLQAGDLIFTGTPEGVGAVQRGDLLEGEIDSVGTLKVRIV